MAYTTPSAPVPRGVKASVIGFQTAMRLVSLIPPASSNPGMPDSAAAGMNALMLASNDMGSLLAAMRAMGGLVVGRDFAGRIRAPAVIAVGTGDPLYPQSQALVAWWPSAQLVVLPGVNHLEIVVRPEVIGALRGLVRR